MIRIMLIFSRYMGIFSLKQSWRFQTWFCSLWFFESVSQDYGFHNLEPLAPSVRRKAQIFLPFPSDDTTLRNENRRPLAVLFEKGSEMAHQALVMYLPHAMYGDLWNADYCLPSYTVIWPLRGMEQLLPTWLTKVCIQASRNRQIRFGSHALLLLENYLHACTEADCNWWTLQLLAHNIQPTCFFSLN